MRRFGTFLQVSPGPLAGFGDIFIAVFIANFIAIFAFLVAKMTADFLATGRNEELRNVWALPNLARKTQKITARK